jgi:DNA-binding NarL/FixJ family response regulator
MHPSTRLDVAPSIDRDGALAFLREMRRGAWRLRERAWDRDARIFVFEPSGLTRLASRRELEVLALVSRGASNYEAGWVLGLRDSTVCTYATELARQMGAVPIDLMAFGPLFERAERR